MRLPEICFNSSQTRSAEADSAMARLMAMKRDEGGFVYWSQSKIERNKVRYEFNRPFLEAKDRYDYTDWCSWRLCLQAAQRRAGGGGDRLRSAKLVPA